MASWYLPLAGATLFLAFLKLKDIGRRPKGYPPGPPTLPIIGNLHLMPSKSSHVQFKKWAEEYGPIYSLIVGTQVMIVLSSDTAIKDLLDKRSAIYSSRPEMYVGSTLASGGMRMLLMVCTLFSPEGNAFSYINVGIRRNLASHSQAIPQSPARGSLEVICPIPRP